MLHRSTFTKIMCGTRYLAVLNVVHACMPRLAGDRFHLGISAECKSTAYIPLARIRGEE
jgi:hypothetical protein